MSNFGYPKLKSWDPYHPTVGAVNGGCASRFSDADGGSILVDYNMEENYGTDLAGGSHIGDGVPGSLSGDGSLRAHPLEFEPVINCPVSPATEAYCLSTVRVHVSMLTVNVVTVGGIKRKFCH